MSDLAIRRLISNRMAVLRLGRTKLVRQCGYNNSAKGIRRLNALLAGDFDSTSHMIGRLPTALNLSFNEVAEAIRLSKEQLAAEQEAGERAAFRPHAVLLCERSTPSSITFCALTDGARWLRVDFPADTNPITYVDIVKAAIRQRLEMFGGEIRSFGAATGFAINYSFDCSTVFNLQGNPVDALGHSVKPGHTTLTISGKSQMLPILA